MQRSIFLSFFIAVIYFTSLFGVTGVDAQESNDFENSELIILNKSQILESNDVITGYSFYESPYFKYRVESYTQLGYSFGTLVDVFSENMNITELLNRKIDNIEVCN